MFLKGDMVGCLFFFFLHFSNSGEPKLFYRSADKEQTIAVKSPEGNKFGQPSTRIQNTRSSNQAATELSQREEYIYTSTIVFVVRSKKANSQLLHYVLQPFPSTPAQTG